MNYRKINHFSSDFLSRNITVVYEINSLQEECFYKTIPNGVIGLTIVTKGAGWFYLNNTWEPIPNSSIYGLIKKPTHIKMSKNCREISIGFNPLFLSLFLKIPMNLVSDRFTSAIDVFPKNAVFELEDKLSSALNDSEIIFAIESFLSKHFNNNIDKQLLLAHDKISKIKYTKVEQLSNDLNLSSRTLLNKFNNTIGLSPKELMKIYRINSSLDIKTHNPANLTELAHKLGYFDQAHFIHDFKETLGITPEKYFKNEGLISDFYNLDRWNSI